MPKLHTDKVDSKQIDTCLSTLNLLTLSLSASQETTDLPRLDKDKNLICLESLKTLRSLDFSKEQKKIEHDLTLLLDIASTFTLSLEITKAIVEEIHRAIPFASEQFCNELLANKLLSLTQAHQWYSLEIDLLYSLSQRMHRTGHWKLIGNASELATVWLSMGLQLAFTYDKEKVPLLEKALQQLMQDYLNETLEKDYFSALQKSLHVLSTSLNTLPELLNGLAIVISRLSYQHNYTHKIKLIQGTGLAEKALSIVKSTLLNITQEKMTELMEQLFPLCHTLLTVGQVPLVENLYEAIETKLESNSRSREVWTQYASLKSAVRLELSTAILNAKKQITEEKLTCPNFDWQSHQQQWQILSSKPQKKNVKEQQRDYTQSIVALLQNMLKESQLFLGDLPSAKFAFMSMGSMSRQEMVPGSDLEYFLVLEKILPKEGWEYAYFKQWTRLLSFQMLLLGGVLHLDPFHPGKEEELIDTIDEGFIKNIFTRKVFSISSGKVNSLLRPQWLYGDKELSKNYQQAIQIQLCSPHSKYPDLTQGQVIGLAQLLSDAHEISDDHFTVWRQNAFGKALKLKEKGLCVLHYALSDLVLLYNIYEIDEHSTQQLLQALTDKKILSQQVAESLSYSHITLSELRLKGEKIAEGLNVLNQQLLLLLGLHCASLELPMDFHPSFELLAKSSEKTLSYGVHTRLLLQIAHRLYHQAKMTDYIDDHYVLPSILQLYYQSYLTAYRSSPYIAQVILHLSQLPDKQGHRPQLKTRQLKWQQQVCEVFSLIEHDKKNVVHFQLIDKTTPFHLKAQVNEQWWESKLQKFKLTAPSLSKRHIVMALTYGEFKFHLKCDPDAPSMESAMFSFYQRVAGGGLVESKTVKLSIDEQPYIGLLLQTPEGFLLKQVLEDKRLSACLQPPTIPTTPLRRTVNQQTLLLPGYPQDTADKLDHYRYSRMILADMLTYPEDKKSSHLILQPMKDPNGQMIYDLISIDNDHVFVPAFESIDFFKSIKRSFRGHEKDSCSRRVQVKNILYCFDHMELPLHSDAITEFLMLDPYLTLKAWLKEIENEQTRLQSLFSKKELDIIQARQREKLKALQTSYPELDVPEKPVTLLFALSPYQLARLWDRWQTLRQALLQNAQQSMHQLFEEIDLPLAQFYQQERQKYSTILERWKKMRKEYHVDHSSVQEMSLSIMQSSKDETTDINLLLAYLEKLDENTQTIQKFSATLLQASNMTSQHYSQLESLLTKNKDDTLNRRILLKLLTVLDVKALNESQERFILASLLKTPQPTDTLILRNYRFLTDSFLAQLLSNPVFKSLLKLEITDCKEVTDTSLRTLETYCPSLQTLTLNDLPKLRYISTSIVSNPLVFKQLHTLNIQGCDALLTVRIDSPKLKTVVINAKNLTDITTNSQSLEKLVLREVKLLTSKMIESAGSLKTLNYLDISGSGIEVLKIETPMLLTLLAENCVSLKGINIFSDDLLMRASSFVKKFEDEILKPLEIIKEKRLLFIQSLMTTLKQWSSNEKKIQNALIKLVNKDLKYVGRSIWDFAKNESREPFYDVADTRLLEETDFRIWVVKALSYLGYLEKEIIQMLKNCNISYSLAVELIQLGQDDPEPVQKRKIKKDLLSQFYNKNKIKLLFNQLKDESFYIRKSAAKTLIQLGYGGDETILDVFFIALKDPEVNIIELGKFVKIFSIDNLFKTLAIQVAVFKITEASSIKNSITDSPLEIDAVSSEKFIIKETQSKKVSELQILDLPFNGNSLVLLPSTSPEAKEDLKNLKQDSMSSSSELIVEKNYLEKEKKSEKIGLGLVHGTLFALKLAKKEEVISLEEYDLVKREFTQNSK